MQCTCWSKKVSSLLSNDDAKDLKYNVNFFLMCSCSHWLQHCELVQSISLCKRQRNLWREILNNKSMKTVKTTICLQVINEVILKLNKKRLSKHPSVWSLWILSPRLTRGHCSSHLLSNKGLLGASRQHSYIWLYVRAFMPLVRWQVSDKNRMQQQSPKLLLRKLAT